MGNEGDSLDETKKSSPRAAHEGKPKALNSRQMKFIEAYAGNGVEAARAAGYEGDENVLAVQANRLMRVPEIKEAIREREKRNISKAIATREDRQAFWTRVMNDDLAEMRDRLTASSLLGKSEADFTEKHEHKGQVTLEQLVVGSQKDE